MAETHVQNIHELKIANRIFSSSLMLGTGKYKNNIECMKSIIASETAIVTVAIRRAYNNKENLLHILDWKKLWLLPNTAGCQSADEAIKMAYLGKELNHKIGQTDNTFLKLEVIPDTKYLLPDPLGTLKAAEYLTKKGFSILAYTNADPILAKQLEEVGCSAIMPLASPIGSGKGLLNPFNLSIIIENSSIPVIIDAGIGTASEASQAMELGADGVLINTAIAEAGSPSTMAYAMKLAVESGKYSYIAGRMEKKIYAIASSPTTGIPIQFK